MALPRDITGWSEVEVQAILDSAKADLLAGAKVVSWSSAGSSVSKQITPGTSPSDLIAWCQWMLRELNPDVHGYNRSRSKVVFY